MPIYPGASLSKGQDDPHTSVVGFLTKHLLWRTFECTLKGGVSNENNPSYRFSQKYSQFH
jgi:hypothetical protein